MADRASRRHPEAAARGAGKKTPTVRRKAAAKTMKKATGRKPAVAEGVRGGKRLGDNQTIRQGEGMGRKGAQGGAKRTERTERTQGTKKKVKKQARVVEKEWAESDPLPDPQHEMFAKAIAYGAYSQTACYLMAYEEVERSTARVNASRLLTYANVAARVEWLKRESVKLFQVNKAEIMRDLYVGWRTPVGHIDLESPLAQEVSYDAQTGAITKVKMPGKTDMLKILLQMEGIEKPANDPLEKAVDAMADMIRMIREKRGPETP